MTTVTINNSHKTGLVVNATRPIFIYEKNNIFSKEKLIYTLPSGEHRFNLPKGKYKIKGVKTLFKNLNSYEYVIPYFHVPKPVKKPPVKFNRKFSDNPNICTVYRSNNTIIWDTKKYHEFSRMQVTFIELHELGHYYFKTLFKRRDARIETKCDLFAAINMLRLGYSPDFIEAAQKTTLKYDETDRENRINSLHLFLTNNLTFSL